MITNEEEKKEEEEEEKMNEDGEELNQYLHLSMILNNWKI